MANPSEPTPVTAEIPEPVDPFIGVFDIHFTGPRRMSSENVRIVHWKTSPNAELFYLITDTGDIINFANVNLMFRVGD